MKKVLVVVGLVFIASLISVNVRADYPLGFSKIHAICKKAPEVSEGLRVFETSILDSSPTNPGGSVVFGCGESPRGIGAHIMFVDVNGDAIRGMVVFHLHGTYGKGNVAQDLITKKETVIGDADVVKFLEVWLLLYTLAFPEEL